MSCVTDKLEVVTHQETAFLWQLVSESGHFGANEQLLVSSALLRTAPQLYSPCEPLAGAELRLGGVKVQGAKPTSSGIKPTAPQKADTQGLRTHGYRQELTT